MSRDDFVHLVENEHPATLRLGQRFAHDLGSDTGNFDVHLQRGNAVARTGDFEVHIAVVVFSAGNIGEDCVLIEFLH